MLDFILLLVAGLSQLALGVLGLRVSVWPPKKKVHKGRYWLAFLCIGVIGLGALVWSGYRSVQVQDAIVDGMEKIKAKLVTREITTVEDSKLFLQCDWTPMPKNLPASGEIFVLESISPDPMNDLGGGGLSKQFGPPNNPLIWSPVEKKIGDFGYKCQLFDYGSGPIFDVRLIFDVLVKKAVKNDGGATSGDIIKTTQWGAYIPKVDQGPEKPFVFYLFNRFWPNFVQINMPPKATYIKDSKSDRASIDVLGNSYGQPIFLNPQDDFNAAGTPK